MKWIDATDADRQQSVHIVAASKDITESAVEKDWWVTAILKVLFSMTPAPYMLFKGGTSLSKGWNLIDRFSEDIDIALYRDFHLDVLGKECAAALNNNQVKKLRMANRDYILGAFMKEFETKLWDCGLGECRLEPVIYQTDGRSVDHDSDPVEIEVHYKPKVKSEQYIRPVVKVEISCLSMKEPFEVKRISSLVGEAFTELDDETVADIPIISPVRTFLEKAFLLNEEYQRKNPRHIRMSRHLYDLERLMDTSFATTALADRKLYREIIEHRQRFYHVGGVDYTLDLPETISFCPKGELRERMKADYEDMKVAMIYGKKLTFEALMTRMEELQERFRLC